MINDNDLLLLASSQNSDTYKVYIDSSGKKTLTPQTNNYETIDKLPYVWYRFNSTIILGLLADKNPKKVRFPNCSKASGNGDNGAFEYAFAGCTSLDSVSFPALTTATGGDENGAFHFAFDDCTSLTSVSFPSLTTATGGSGGSFRNGAFKLAFDGCTSLTSVSFPSLTTVWEIADNTATFLNAFYNCSPSLKVHFKKSMKGKKGLDYQIMGLKSANQVVFDLP